MMLVAMTFTLLRSLCARCCARCARCQIADLCAPRTPRTLRTPFSAASLSIVFREEKGVVGRVLPHNWLLEGTAQTASAAGAASANAVAARGGQGVADHRTVNVEKGGMGPERLRPID